MHLGRRGHDATNEVRSEIRAPGWSSSLTRLKRGCGISLPLSLVQIQLTVKTLLPQPGVRQKSVEGIFGMELIAETVKRELTCTGRGGLTVALPLSQ